MALRLGVMPANFLAEYIELARQSRHVDMNTGTFAVGINFVRTQSYFIYGNYISPRSDRRRKGS
jgi:hypothetical protein